MLTYVGDVQNLLRRDLNVVKYNDTQTDGLGMLGFSFLVYCSAIS